MRRDRLDRFDAYVGPWTAGKSTAGMSKCVSGGRIGRGRKTFDCKGRGSAVKITLPRKQYLTLCEVNIGVRKGSKGARRQAPGLGSGAGGYLPV